MKYNYCNILLLGYRNLHKFILPLLLFLPVVLAALISLFSVKITLFILAILVTILSITIFKILPMEIFIVSITLILQIIGINSLLYTIATNTLFGIFIVIVLFKYSIYHQLINNRAREHILLLLFIMAVISIISMFYNSVYNSDAILEVIRNFSLLFLFIVIYDSLKYPWIVKRLINSVLLVSTVAAFYGLYLIIDKGIQAFVIGEISVFHGIYSNLGNANSIAITVGFSFPVILSYLIYKKNQVNKIFSIFILLFLFTICLLMNSRATYIYLAISSIAVFAFHERRKFYFTLVSIGSATVALVLLFSPLLQKLLRLEMGLSLRDHLWKAAIRIFVENPMFGAGPIEFNNLKYYYIDPGPAKPIAADLFGGEAHNLFLTKAADYGIFFVSTLLLFIIYIIYYFIKNEKEVRNTQCYYIYIASGASFIGLIAKSFFEIGNLIGNARLNENLIPFLFLAIIIKLPVFYCGANVNSD